MEKGNFYGCLLAFFRSEEDEDAYEQYEKLNFTKKKIAPKKEVWNPFANEKNNFGG